MFCVFAFYVFYLVLFCNKLLFAKKALVLGKAFPWTTFWITPFISLVKISGKWSTFLFKDTDPLAASQLCSSSFWPQVPRFSWLCGWQYVPYPKWISDDKGKQEGALPYTLHLTFGRPVAGELIYWLLESCRHFIVTYRPGKWISLKTWPADEYKSCLSL